MTKTKKLVFVAGEESGDLHAANIINNLKIKHSHLQISGIGGIHMQEAGVDLLSDLARFGVTGISEVIRHAVVIHAAFKTIKAHLVKHKPDLLILIDYPGFNLRLAKFAKKHLNIRILYYISPQIWAWKAGRINLIRQYIDHMAVIFPFEKQIYTQANVPVSFVGHPLVNKLELYNNTRHKFSEANGLQGDANLASSQQNDSSIEFLKRANKRLIALLPGSRVNEIELHMPVLCSVMKKLVSLYDDLHFVIPVARTISTNLIAQYISDENLPITLINGQAIEVAACSDCIVVASGTASLECALLQKPMCIIYKVSLFSSLAASQLLKVQYAGLCNVLQNRMIVPELLQYDCNPEELANVVINLLSNSSNPMIQRLQNFKESLSIDKADCTIEQLIELELKKTSNM